MTFIICVSGQLVFVIAPGVSVYLELAGVVFFAWLIASYTGAALVNPGITLGYYVELAKEDDETSLNYCDYCQAYMQPQAKHCQECEVCIEEYDHHCPWTTKCIGKGNVKYFHSFLISFLVCFIYSIIVLGLHAHAANHRKG